jgi:hypothetical protein
MSPRDAVSHTHSPHHSPRDDGKPQAHQMKIGTLLLAKKLAGKTRQRLQSAVPKSAAAAAAAAAAMPQPRARARRGSVLGLHAVDQARGHRVLTQTSQLDAPDSDRIGGSTRALMVTAQHMHLSHDESAQHYSSTVRSAWEHLPAALKALKEASRAWRRELHITLETAVNLLSACLAHDKSVADVLSAYSAETSPVSV